MSKLSENLRMAMSASGMTQTELAYRVGIKQQAIQWLCNSKNNPQGSKHLHKIAAALGVTPDWLLHGDSTPQRVQNAAHVAEPFNVSYAPRIRGHVPLISWVQAGSMREAIDIYQPGDGEDWLPCPSSHGPHTFALRVQGDSMTAPHGGRSYPEGLIIFVDPDRAITNGCRVVARDQEQRATFKVYVEDAGRRYLKPLNPQYPLIEMDHQYEIVGVVIGAYMAE